MTDHRYVSLKVDRDQPNLTGSFQRDRERLRTVAERGDLELAALPEPVERSAEEREHALRTVHEPCRAVRNHFMHLYAEEVYDEITDGRNEYSTIGELTESASVVFPGLVPTAQQLDEERCRPQAAKETREIDQGIFFRALLRAPRARFHLLDAMMLPTTRALAMLERFERDGDLVLPTASLTRRGRAVILGLGNTACLNAEDEPFLDDLETLLDIAILDTASDVCVLRGDVMTHPRYAGRRVFSAGINLRELAAGRITLTGFLLKRELGLLAKLHHGLLTDPAPGADPHRTRQKPWIAAVDGFAIGGGFQIVLTVDRVVAAEDAYFSLPAAKEGIVPGAANLRLPRLTGAALARRMILGGRRIGATEPEASLFVDDVVRAEDVTGQVDAACEDLADQAIVSNRRMLNLAQEPVGSLLDYLAEFAYVQSVRMHAPDVTSKAGAH